MTRSILRNQLPFSLSSYSLVGLSQTAKELCDATAAIATVGSAHSSRDIRRREMIDAVLDAALEAREDGWSGPGSKAVLPSTMRQAIRFIEMLPDWVAIPEITPDNDGDISFDWVEARGYAFAVSIRPTGLMNWAGIFGAFGNNGREYLGESIPEIVLHGVRRAHTRRG